MLCYVATKLSNLHFSCQFSFEAAEHYFSLARLEPVANAGNRSSAISNREQNQLFINEVSIAQLAHIVIYKSGNRIVRGKPNFTRICKLLRESKLNLVVIFFVDVFKVDFMVFYRSEVLLAFLRC